MSPFWGTLSQDSTVNARHPAPPPPVQRFGQIAEHADGRTGLPRSCTMSGVSALNSPVACVEIVAAFGDGQRDDARLGRGQRVQEQPPFLRAQIEYRTREPMTRASSPSALRVTTVYRQSWGASASRIGLSAGRRPTPQMPHSRFRSPAQEIVQCRPLRAPGETRRRRYGQCRA